MWSARAPRRVAMASASRAGQRRRIAADPLGEQRGEPRFLEHVEIVVRGRAVGADADVQSQLQHAGDRRHARAELEVARRIVGDAGAGILQRPHLAVVHVHAVRGEHLRAEEALFLDPGNHRHPVRLPRVSTSRSVSERWVWSGTSNSAASSAHARRISGVQVYGACGAGAGHDQRMAAPSLDEVPGAAPASPRSSSRRARGSAAPSARTVRAGRRRPWPRPLPLRSSTCRRSRSRRTGSSRRTRAGCRA